MQAIVDPDVCTGCGLCADSCPVVFQMDAAVAKVVVTNVPAEALDICRQAAENCPVEAIKIKE